MDGSNGIIMIPNNIKGAKIPKNFKEEKTMNAKVMGNNLMIVTTKTLKELAEIEKRRPKALLVTEEIDGEIAEVFRVTVGARGAISNYGISFNAETNTEPKCAMLTVDVGHKPSGMEMQEYVADKFGPALVYLGEIEARLDAAQEDIQAEKEMLAGLIEVAL